jgi:DNA-binding NarL/FixJ family response regulator
MRAFRILIADDHEVVRRGIRALIESHPGWEVCADAVDGREAVERARELKPDLVLLDIGMPNLNGMEAARQILANRPVTHILVLTMHYSEQTVKEVLAVGARGFLLKSDAGRDLVTAVEAVQDNRTFFTSKVAEIVVDGYLNPTRKELSHPPGARGHAAFGGGKNQQGSGGSFKSQCKNCRNPPHQYHAQA